MMWFAGAILAGAVAGSVHVVTGPDHLAAVAPLAMQSRRSAWRIGLMWGVGHSTGTWVLASLALVFRESIPVDLVSAWSERLVGAVLIGVGLWAAQRLLMGTPHSREHSHDGLAHSHPHEGGREVHTHGRGALGIGTLHGLAGTSHILGILPALALPTRAGAIAYVVAFGLGSIFAMTGFAWLCGAVATTRAGRERRLSRSLTLATSMCAIGLGIYWLVDSVGTAT
jgi:cytochrome c biogenesis protein CcdA